MATYKTMKALFKSIDKIVDELVDKTNMKKVGKEAKEMVQKRTRLGYGCTEDGKKYKLSTVPHSPEYTKWRKKHRGRLSSTTSPKKQNLTLSGEMLDDMDYTAEDNEVEIGFKSSKMEDRAQYNTDNDRPFMNLTKQEQKRITQFIQKLADKIIKKK